MSTSLDRDLMFIIFQFLKQEKYETTLHILERESGLFFNLKYFEEQVHNGNWDEVDKYLSGFTKLNDNQYSTKMFFEIRKLKYIEALDKRDQKKAVEILSGDLKVFNSLNKELYEEMQKLLTLDNIREHEIMSGYRDTKSARLALVVMLKELLQRNPIFHDKLQFPDIKGSRLRIMTNQSCGRDEIEAELAASRANLQLGLAPKAGSSLPLPPAILGAAPTPIPTIRRPIPFSINHPTDSGVPIGLGAPLVPVVLTHPGIPPTNSPVDNPSGVSNQVIKSTTPISLTEEINIPDIKLPVLFTQHGNNLNARDVLPLSLVWTLNQGSSPTSMDFHPQKQTLLLVGTTVGDIALWEVISRERLALKNFKVWNLSASSMSPQSSVVMDPHVSVNRVIWSRDGSFFGVAYSRNIVQIYSYKENDDVGQHLEIDAHVGGVNDLAFCHLLKKLYLMTGGDDKTIKVWDATTGTRQYVFEGHEAPVYCVCLHSQKVIPFILSTGLDGTIKAWVYNGKESVVNYDAPGCGLSTMATTVAYSSDGRRVFSCGTSNFGEARIVELDEAEGSVMRTYRGLQKRATGVVQFDTAQNQFLAAGDDFSIKFWHMDNSELLFTAFVDGNIPARPQIRFNKDGSLLAASGNENKIKILANNHVIGLLKTFENLTFGAPRSEAANKATVNPGSAAGTSSAGLADRVASVVSISGLKGDTRNWVRVKPKKTKGCCDKSKVWMVMEINKPSQCRSLILPENVGVTKISRLIHTNSGSALLALSSNAIHLLWKWKQSAQNSVGKATASDSPQLWQPASGILMTNNVADSGHEKAIHCLALSKNDCFIVSASGGNISIYNTITFKVMTTFMDPPPAATFLAFHPNNNNIIAIGIDDSTILIYESSYKEVIKKLKGHSKRITGLAFSQVLNLLVSSGADARLCIWRSKGNWEKVNSIFLQLPASGVPSQQSDTHVQFHQDQIQFLVVHETQLAIYEAKKLECQKQWLPGDSAAPIFHGTFSCDSKLVYASFLDASVCVFTADHLRMQCRISPSAYLPIGVSACLNQWQLVIAAHPQEPNQFAIGLSEGAVYVIEPLESQGKWGVPSRSQGSNGES